MVLLDFTGSDWCGWCIKLRKDTFSKPEFQKFAEEKLVLVELDFPRKKEQNAELKKQNQELAEKFGIEGFPTLVLVDPKGTEVTRNVGYLAGGPEGFAKWVESARKPSSFAASGNVNAEQSSKGSMEPKDSHHPRKCAWKVSVSGVTCRYV